MISRKTLASVSVIALLAMASQAFANDANIAFSADTSYPESMTWSAAQNGFFVGSVRHGGVGKLSLDGSYTTFITDPSLISTVGLLVDDQTNTLWVTNSDPSAGEGTTADTVGTLAGIAAYDATTGIRRSYYDLGTLKEGAHFANDMALDADGNLYVTDSFSPVVYRITADGTAAIFAQSPLFLDGEGFNLNGIAWVSEGYLLIGKYNSGEIFRISTSDPADITRVQLPEALIGADGFHLIDNTHMLVVQNMGADRTVELISTDGWATATMGAVKESVMSMPTAAVDADGAIYVLNSRLDTLFDPNAEKVSDYLLQKF